MLLDLSLAALEARIQRAENEKQRAVDIQTELARMYREISTAITGYQVVLPFGQEPQV